METVETLQTSFNLAYLIFLTMGGTAILNYYLPFGIRRRPNRALNNNHLQTDNFIETKAEIYAPMPKHAQNQNVPQLQNDSIPDVEIDVSLFDTQLICDFLNVICACLPTIFP